jgi:hypothetical protein
MRKPAYISSAIAARINAKTQFFTRMSTNPFNDRCRLLVSEGAGFNAFGDGYRARDEKKSPHNPKFSAVKGHIHFLKGVC